MVFSVAPYDFRTFQICPKDAPSVSAHHGGAIWIISVGDIDMTKLGTRGMSRSDQHGTEVSECEIGREAYAPHRPFNNRGALVMTSAWLAVYVILVILAVHQSIPSGSWMVLAGTF